MDPIERDDRELVEQALAVREFNRFYTSKLGLLQRSHLGGDFSLTEARILYEIAAHPSITAGALCDCLEVDPGYLSRVLTNLAKRGLVRHTRSRLDGRSKHLYLTPAGKRAAENINRRSTEQLTQWLVATAPSYRQALVAALQQAQSILSIHSDTSLRIERLEDVTDDALSILAEYYEAVDVVQRDSPVTLTKMLFKKEIAIWLAYVGEDVVGCVELKKLQAFPSACECKRLYVRPSARGKRVADALLDTQESFAREQGYRWIYLDTYDALEAAIRLYKRRGYRRCPRYNENPQATIFMRKRIL